MHTQWFWFRGLGGYPKGHRPSRVGDRWPLGPLEFILLGLEGSQSQERRGL